MKLDQLIEAAEKATPEIIEEINRRIYEILCPGECYHSYEFIEDQDYGDGCWPGDRTYSHTMAVHKCTRCGNKFDKLIHGSGGGHNKRYIELPDYTKAENFWPLAWENDITVVKVTQGSFLHTLATNDIKGFILSQRPEKILQIWLHGDNPGIAVCLTYLKAKEQQND